MKKQIRVVHMTTVHHPHDPRIYYKQCLSLQRANYETYLIAQPADEPIEAGDGVKHIPLKKYNSRLKRMLFGTWEAYKKAKQLQADIYVFHDPELMPIGALLKRENNIVIYDIHEDYVTSILQKPYLKRPLRRMLARGYRIAEKLFTRKMELSLAEKYYEQLYPKGTTILNYPLLNERFLEIDRSKQQNVDKLIYTGNVTEDRGALIHANIPNIDPAVSVQFVGKCARPLAEKMYKVAGPYKDNIAIEGIDEFVVKEKMETYYIRENWLAGIALFPPTDHYMKKELTKFFEYMNAGLPIICSDFPTWKKFIETYECGIAVDENNPDAIRAAIQTLRENRALAEQLGENGRRAVIEELNWKVEETKLLNWYEQLIEEKLH